MPINNAEQDPASESITLKAWRKEADLTAEEVAQLIVADLGENSRHFTSVTKIERQGTQKISLIRAYARAIQRPFDSVLPLLESLALKNSSRQRV